MTDLRVHALVSDADAARRAAAAGATVVQLRVKGAPTAYVVALGRALRDLPVPLVVNDDVDAALELRCGVHLGQGDHGVERAREAGLLLGLSATTVAETVSAAAAGCDYVGVGPVWETPSKPDAAAPLGPDGLREACSAVTVPVVAIGGIDATNAAACIAAGAAGVAVIRAVADMRALRAAVDAALA